MSANSLFGDLTKRKQWMADPLKLRGREIIGAGPGEKLTSGGKSLLPIGVVEVRGEFARGEVIACASPEGE